MDELPFFYHAWVEDGSTFLRPRMWCWARLRRVPEKKGNTPKRIRRFISMEKHRVRRSFCYWGENVLNEDDQLLIDGPHTIFRLTKFTYSFVLRQLPAVYQAPKLRVFASNDAVTSSSERCSAIIHGRTDRVERADSQLRTFRAERRKWIGHGRLEQFKTIVGQYFYVQTCRGNECGGAAHQ